MEVKIDLHNHLASLEYIGDDFGAIVNQAKANLGKSGIFSVLNSLRCYRGGFLGKRLVTENRFQAFMGLERDKVQEHENFLYIPEHDIYVIYGQEVLTTDGHVLVIGMDKKVTLPDKKSLEYTVRTAKEKYNAAVIASHPEFLDGVVRNNEIGFLRNIKYFDGFEVHTGESWLLPFANPNAQKYYQWLCARGFNIGAVCSSDGHSIHEVGSSHSIIESPDFSSSDRLRETLQRSIKAHKDYSKDKRKNSYIGAFDHAAKRIAGNIAYQLGLFPRVA